MSTFLGALAFAAFVLAQIAAVVALHRAKNARQPQGFDEAQRDPRVRLIEHSGG